MTPLPIRNLAAYQFLPLTELPDLKQRLYAYCSEADLRGSILLAPEGFNLFLAGTPDAIAAFQDRLRMWISPDFDDFKHSDSETQPFHRLFVKIKREIIAFGTPFPGTAPHIAPETLQAWLAEKRPLRLLDTRNTYEHELGAFTDAHCLPLAHFRDFPRAAAALPEDWKTTPIVTYCTGGIRCEKAAPYLNSIGFETVYQLDGGILRYFERCGTAHYTGECFVFDHRVALDAELLPTQTAQCFQCRWPVSVSQQQDPRYQIGVSCPACARSSELMESHL